MSFSSVLSGIGGFFKKLFGENADLAQIVLHKVSSFTAFADPIVADLEAMISKELAQTAGAPGILADVEKFLLLYTKDEAVVKSFLTQYGTYSVADLLHAAARFALMTYVPAGTDLTLINMAVEFAYNMYVQKHPTKPTAAMPLPYPVVPAVAA